MTPSLPAPPAGFLTEGHGDDRRIFVSYRAGTVARRERARPSTGMQSARRTAGPGVCRRPRLQVVALAGLLVQALAAQSPDGALAEAERHRSEGKPAEALAVLTRAAERFPDQSLIHFNLGSLLGEHSRYDEAARALRAGLALDPAHAEARLTLAKVLVGSHRYEEALAEVDRYARLVGDLLQGFDGHYVRGLALRRLDRLGDAERELRRAAEINPGHADALFNLGAVLEQLGSDEEAMAYLRKAADLQPENPDTRYRLGKLLLELGETDRGEAELEAFQELRQRAQQESRASVLMRQAERRMDAGNPEQAKQLYQQVLRQDPQHAEALANLGVAYEQLGRSDLAEAMFRKALDLRPDYADAHLNLGLTLAESERFRAALESIAEAVRLDPGHVAARQAMGMVLTRLDRPLEAVPHFRRVVVEIPSSADARLNLGIALAEGGSLEDALAEFDEAARLSPESFRPHYNRGRALNDLGRSDEAREALEIAIGLNGRYAPALQLLGAIERVAGRSERAVELLQRAAEFDPGNPLVHYDLGLAVAQAGRAQDAIPYWERVLALDSRHKETLYNLAQALHSVEPERAREYRDRFAALKAEEQDTDRAGTLWNFALAEADRERWDRAFELFRQALEACGNCPARGQIHKNFGLVYGHSGDYASAAEELSKALQLLPDDEEIKRALKIVQSSGSP